MGQSTHSNSNPANRDSRDGQRDDSLDNGQAGTQDESTGHPTNSNALSEGVRTQAAAQFMPLESDPDRGRYIFIYRITITNESDRTVQLLSRRWQIIDGNGRREVVQGDGVVGKQPILSPGETFEYTSYCPMRTEWGTMEGAFTFMDSEQSGFDAQVGRFYMAISSDNAILS